MRLSFFTSALFFGLAATCFAKRPNEFVPGEVIVQFKPSVGMSAQKGIIGNKAHALLRSVGDFGRVKIKAEDDVIKAAASYRNDPNVVSAQPNYIYRVKAVPNDPLLSQQWSLRNTAQNIVPANGPDQPSPLENAGTEGVDIAATKAWDVVTDCSGITVAVVDSGVNYNHEDLAPNMWDGGTAYPHHGYNFAESTNDPMDYLGHGTFVSSIIGARGNNGIGGTGICWRAKIMALKAIGNDGLGNTLDIANAIVFAANNGAKIINLSLGGPSSDPAMEAAITFAASKGALLVSAAGNEGENNDATPSYPCASPSANMICVAAVDQKNALAAFSNYGAQTVDIAAPGVNMLGAWFGEVKKIQESLEESGWTKTVFGGANSDGWRFDSIVEDTPEGLKDRFLIYTPTTGANADTRVYRTTNTGFSGYSKVEINLNEFLGIRKVPGKLQIACSRAGGDPFVTAPRLTYTESENGSKAKKVAFDISYCLSSNMSWGFRYLGEPASSASVNQTGTTNIPGVMTAKDFRPFIEVGGGGDTGGSGGGGGDGPPGGGGGSPGGGTGSGDPGEGSSPIGFLPPDGIFMMGPVTFTFWKVSNQSLYNVLDGTSFSSPTVAGIAALVKSQNPNYTAAEIKTAILNSGITVPALAGKTLTGKAANAQGAVTYLAPPTGVTVSK